MRIWILSSNRWNSAITEYALRAAQSLMQNGHEILFSPLQGSPSEKRAADLGLSVRSFESFSVWDLKNIKKTAVAWGPEAILTCGGKDQALIALAGLKPISQFRFRGERVRAFNRRSKLIHSLSHKNTKAFIVPCQAVREDLARISQKPIHLVTLGLDETFWTPSRAPTERPECVIFGRFDPVKGHKEFIRLWKSVLAEYCHRFPNRTRPLLRCVGRAENLSQSDLLEEIKKLGLEGDVTVTQDSISKPQILLSSAALGVIPSLGSEVICRVAQEFLLCGTPVLVSTVGGLKEVLFKGAGDFFDYADPKASEKILGVLETYLEESQSAKQTRRSEASQRFCLKQMAKHLEQILQP